MQKKGVLRKEKLGIKAREVSILWNRREEFINEIRGINAKKR